MELAQIYEMLNGVEGGADAVASLKKEFAVLCNKAKKLLICRISEVFRLVQNIILFCKVSYNRFPPYALFPANEEKDGPCAFITHHGNPYTYQTPAPMDT